MSCEWVCSSEAPARGAVVLEDHDVAEARVLLQVDDAVAVGPEDILDLLVRQVAQRQHVVGRLDDDLVRADAVHLVVEAVALLVEVALDPQGGELVGHHAQRQPGCVRAAARRPVGQDLGRRLGLVAGAERAEVAARRNRRARARSRWALGAVGGDDHPAAGDGVFAQFRQSGKSSLERNRRALVL